MTDRLGKPSDCKGFQCLLPYLNNDKLLISEVDWTPRHHGHHTSNTMFEHEPLSEFSIVLIIVCVTFLIVIMSLSVVSHL